MIKKRDADISGWGITIGVCLAGLISVFLFSIIYVWPGRMSVRLYLSITIGSLILSELITYLIAEHDDEDIDQDNDCEMCC